MDRLLINDTVLRALINNGAAVLGYAVSDANTGVTNYDNIRESLLMCMRDLTIAVAVCEALQKDKSSG